MKKLSERNYDRAIIIKAMAGELLREYGEEAYRCFVEANYEKLVIPALRGPWGRIMP